jgi:hypothetical protein
MWFSFVPYWNRACSGQVHENFTETSCVYYYSVIQYMWCKLSKISEWLAQIFQLQIFTVYNKTHQTITRIATTLTQVNSVQISISHFLARRHWTHRKRTTNLWIGHNWEGRSELRNSMDYSVSMIGNLRVQSSAVNSLRHLPGCR